MSLKFEDPDLINTPLADSGFTVGWTLQTLSDNCAEFRAATSNNKVENVSVITLGEGQGFTSLVYKVTVKFVESGADAFAFVAKVPSATAFNQFAAAQHSTDPNAKSVAKHLARFHAYLLAKDVDVKGIVQPGYHYQMDQFFQDRYKQTTLELCESSPTFQPLLKKIEPFATVEFVKYAIFERANELGNPMFDLASFLVPSADGDVRREAEQSVIQPYYDELAAQLRQAGKSVPFGVEQLQEAYKLAFIVKTMEMIQCPPTLAKRMVGVDERIKEAQLAKIELRTKIVLQDAIRFAEEVGPDFFAHHK